MLICSPRFQNPISKYLDRGPSISHHNWNSETIIKFYLELDPYFHESGGAKDLVDGRDENLGGQGKVSLGEVMEKTAADQDPSMPKWDQSTLLYPSVAEEQRGK